NPRSYRTQAQGDAHAKEDTGDVAGVTHDGVGDGGDDLLTTLRLDANRYLEELVDGFRPGQDSHADQEQDVPDATDPPAHRQPLKSAIVQCGDGNEGIHRWKEESQQDFVPA